MFAKWHVSSFKVQAFQTKRQVLRTHNNSLDKELILKSSPVTV